MLRFDNRFARQKRCGPPPEFPPASSCPSIAHHLSGPNLCAQTPPRRTAATLRRVGGAPGRGDQAPQLPGSRPCVQLPAPLLQADGASPGPGRNQTTPRRAGGPKLTGGARERGARRPFTGPSRGCSPKTTEAREHDRRFHFAFGVRTGPMTRAQVRLLGPCFKTGRVDDPRTITGPSGSASHRATGEPACRLGGGGALAPPAPSQSADSGRSGRTRGSLPRRTRRAESARPYPEPRPRPREPSSRPIAPGFWPGPAPTPGGGEQEPRDAHADAGPCGLPDGFVISPAGPTRARGDASPLAPRGRARWPTPALARAGPRESRHWEGRRDACPLPQPPRDHCRDANRGGGRPATAPPTKRAGRRRGLERTGGPPPEARRSGNPCGVGDSRFLPVGSTRLPLNGFTSS